MKQPKRSTLKRKADTRFSLLVRSVGYCQASGKDDVRCAGVLQCAHVEGRRNHRLRWERLNAICLCAGHHRWYSDYPLAWADFVRTHYPAHYEFVSAHRGEMWDKDYARVFAALEGAL